MVAREPQLRRRGFFLHSSDSGEPDTANMRIPRDSSSGFAPSEPRQLVRWSALAAVFQAAGRGATKANPPKTSLQSDQGA